MPKTEQVASKTDASDVVDLVVAVQEQAERLADAAITRAIKRVEEEATAIMEKVGLMNTEAVRLLKKDLAKVRRNIMKIEMPDGTLRPLSKMMNPYLPQVLKLVAMGENVCLVGPAGCGKTQLAFQVAEGLGVDFSTINFTSGTSESWLLGRHTPTGYIEACLTIRAKQGGLFFADEMDAADPNVTLVLNTMLDSNILYNPMTGETIKIHPDFRFLAAANTALRGADAVYSGRNRQDGAFRDRFVLFKVDYVDEVDAAVCPDDVIRKKFQKARKTLVELNSSEVLSSRALRKAYIMTKAGWDMKDIVKSICMGWPEETIVSCRFYDDADVDDLSTNAKLALLRKALVMALPKVGERYRRYGHLVLSNGWHDLPFQKEGGDFENFRCVCQHGAEYHDDLKSPCKKCKCPHFWYDFNDPNNDNYRAKDQTGAHDHYIDVK